MNAPLVPSDPQLAQAFFQLGQILTSTADLHSMLGAMVDLTLDIVDADVALLRLLDREGEHLDVAIARGLPRDVLDQVRLGPGQGLAGRLLVDGTPMRGLNLQHDPRMLQRSLAQRYDLQSFAGVAIQLHAQPVGVWFVVRQRRELFEDKALNTLLSIADYMSLAIERNQLIDTIIRDKHESETVLQASANGILVVDSHGRVVDMNPALSKLTGWTHREARGQPCCDVIGCHTKEQADSAEFEICPLRVAEDGQDRAFLQYRIRTREGESIPVEASYGLVHDQDGSLRRVVMVFRDISQQEELSRMRAEFVANVSHELRTPLALIKGYATTMLSPEVALDAAQTRRFLTNVNSAADRLGRMIDDLLCASRLDSDMLQLEYQHFNLMFIIQQILVWFEPLAQGRILEVDLPSEGLQVWADPERVEQVLVNLLTNAVKHSPSDRPVRIAGQRVSDPPQVLVHIIDEGEGIAARHLPHIFDRFYVTEKSKKSAIGLGLYICRELVEAMGGQIWAISEEGQGSTFSFSLPVQAPGD